MALSPPMALHPVVLRRKASVLARTAIVGHEIVRSMEELPVEGGLDLHEIRHGLKLKRDTGSSTLFENRAGYACPACNRVFTTLYVSQERCSSFRPGQPTDFCVVRESDRLLLLTHG